MAPISMDQIANNEADIRMLNAGFSALLNALVDKRALDASGLDVIERRMATSVAMGGFSSVDMQANRAQFIQATFAGLLSKLDE